MSRQRTLDFRGERLGTVWERLPARWRQEVLALYAQLITRAAQRPREAARTERKGGPERWVS